MNLIRFHCNRILHWYGLSKVCFPSLDPYFCYCTLNVYFFIVDFILLFKLIFCHVAMFHATQCEEYDKFNTNHHCLEVVTEEDSFMPHNGVFVCCKVICSICSSSYGNEGVTRCVEHSDGCLKTTI